MEALWQGKKGDKGAQGDKGEKGSKGDKGNALSPALRKAIAYMLLLAIALSGANLYWTSHEVNASHAAQVREQVAQQRQAQHVFSLLCTTFGELAANKVPPGNPATNPSRAFDLRQHNILDQLGADLGCKLA
jgi:hypothetical protein